MLVKGGPGIIIIDIDKCMIIVLYIELKGIATARIKFECYKTATL